APPATRRRAPRAARFRHRRRAGAEPILAALSPPRRLPLSRSLDQPPSAPAVAKRSQRVLSASPSRVKQGSKMTIVPRAQQRNVTRRETCGGACQWRRHPTRPAAGNSSKRGGGDRLGVLGREKPRRIHALTF